jgi:hypothetical protein
MAYLERICEPAESNHDEQIVLWVMYRWHSEIEF